MAMKVDKVLERLPGRKKKMTVVSHSELKCSIFLINNSSKCHAIPIQRFLTLMNVLLFYSIGHYEGCILKKFNRRHIFASHWQSIFFLSWKSVSLTPLIWGLHFAYWLDTCTVFNYHFYRFSDFEREIRRNVLGILAKWVILLNMLLLFETYYSGQSWA